MSFLSKLFGQKKDKKPSGQPEIKKVEPNTDDAYVESCLILAFSEMEEEREWNTYQDVVQVRNLLNDDKYTEFLAFANPLKEKYTDFDLLYSWMALAHRKQKHYDLARQVLQEGLKVCRRKYYLCDAFGNTEFEAGNLAEAVTWWIQSVLLQETYEKHDTWAYSPFLNLAYVSQALGMSTLRDRFFEESDGRLDGQRFDQPKADEFFRKVRNAQGISSIRKVLELLGQNDLKATSTIREQPSSRAIPMKECLSCHNKVESLRRVCPHCGKDSFTYANIQEMNEANQQAEEAAQHVDRGSQFFRQSRYVEAENEFIKAIEVNPYNDVAHNNVAILLLNQGRSDEAIPWLEKAIALNPFDKEIQEDLNLAKAKAKKTTS